VLSPTNGIKAHDDSVQQGGKVMKKFLSQMEREHVVPFVVGAGMGVCVLEAHTSVHRTRQAQ
jgi:hypothetical protein